MASFAASFLLVIPVSMAADSDLFVDRGSTTAAAAESLEGLAKRDASRLAQIPSATPGFADLPPASAIARRSWSSNPTGSASFHGIGR
jgi:hypothetical protein